MLHTFRSLFLTRLAPVIALSGLLIAGIGVQSVGLVSAANTTYYVDCAGNDANNGTSTSTPWRTMARASQQTYGAGDQILFKRGCTFSGTGFKPVGNGSVSSPVTIADFGSGNLPALDGVGTNEPALLLKNVQNYIVRNLDLTQHGQTPQAIGENNEHGKDADTNSDTYMRAVVHILGLGPVGVQACGEACTVRNVTLDGLVVHDGSWNGIFSGAGYYQLDMNTWGYVDNVVIQNTESRNHHKAGVEFTSTYTKNITYHTTNIKVLNSYLHDNGGDGIMAGPADHILLDGNECSFNGLIRNARLGCWTWDSHDAVIQFSESHHNTTPVNHNLARDGGGYDCDLGSEDCLIQYSWSHDNSGEGYLLMTWPIGFGFNRGTSHNIHMRYNIGERDGKKLAGGITVFGGVDPVIIYNNTIYYEPARLAGTTMFQHEGGALTSDTWGKSGSPIGYTFNNLFITNGTVNPSAVSNNAWSNGNGTWTINRNLWYRVEGGVRFDWGGLVTTFAGWQAKGFDANGINANPLIAGPVGGGPNAYILQSGSPAINAGQTVTQGLRGMGTRDYFGNSIPAGGAFDIGAAESGGAPAPTNTPTRTATPVPPTNTPGGPTNTPTPTPTRTNTPVGPTATNTPSGGTNLALGKTVTVSSFNAASSDGNPEAVDANLTTYWRTNKSSVLTNEWIVVDLGSNQSIDTVVLKWNNYWATSYTIQTSTDNVNWTTKFTTTSGDGGTDTITFASSSVRYVKMNSTAWNHASERLRLNEIEIYQ